MHYISGPMPFLESSNPRVLNLVERRGLAQFAVKVEGVAKLDNARDYDGRRKIAEATAASICA